MQQHTTQCDTSVAICGSAGARQQSLFIRKTSVEAAATLCPDCNPVVNCENIGPSSFRISLKYPHGLFVNIGDTRVLAPRRVPVLCTPSTLSLDDVLSSPDGGLTYVSETVLHLKSTLAGLETFLTPRTGALCTKMGINGNVLVSSLADRLPREHKLTLSNGNVQLRSDYPCTLSGAMATYLNLEPQGSRLLHVGYIPTTQIPFHIKDNTDEELAIACERINVCSGGSYMAEPGSIDFELPGELVTVILPRGWYTLQVVQALLTQALQKFKMRIVATHAGLEFVAPYAFGIRFDSTTGLDPTHIGHLQVPARGLTQYGPTEVCRSRVLPLSAQVGPQLRFHVHNSQIVLYTTLAAPVPASCSDINKSGEVTLELDEVGPWIEGDIVEIGHQDSFETSTAMVLKDSSPLLLRIRCTRSIKIPKRVVVRSVSWVNSLSGRATWLTPSHFDTSLHQTLAKVVHLSSINVGS